MLPLASAPPSRSGRLESLDGLRGLAALVVVLFHVMLVAPDLAGVEREPHTKVDFVWLLAYSPLRLLWSGDEAVVVFFVLSGFVLALPLRYRRADWIDYYPRRLLRLYIPVWASIALTLVWRLTVPRVTNPGDSWWIADHAVPLSLRGIVGDMTLLLGTTEANSVLWSLRWEVWFSLALPAYVLVLVRARRHPIIKLAALAVLAQTGQVLDLNWMRWLPVFGMGAVAAAHLDEIRRRSAALRLARGAAVLVVALALLESRWLLLGTVPVAGVTAIGALGLVVLFATWGPTITVGAFRPVLWLGKVSFSLYLVHEPVVVSTALVLGTRDPLVTGLIAVPAALVLAELFHRVVETPAHRLAKIAGKCTSSAMRRRRCLRNDSIGGELTARTHWSDGRIVLTPSAPSSPVDGSGPPATDPSRGP